MEEIGKENDVSHEGLEQAKEIVEQYEGLTREHMGVTGWIISIVAVCTSIFFLYTAAYSVTTQILRGIFVMLTMFLIMLIYPATKKQRYTLPFYDWVLALLIILPILNMLSGFDNFLDRSVDPNSWDMVMGILLIALILEAMRRTTGWILSAIVLAFLIYAYIGPYLPSPWNHRGYGIDRIVGQMYMCMEGIFSVPIDVASTLIILFTIYGAFLSESGAGKFFIDFSFAVMGRKSTSAGRTALLASFLLGGPSGSGVATTVTIGAVAWPMLKKAGYNKDVAGGFLAAAGLGAVLSPPVMGAAAFLICEFLKVSYLEVMRMAVMPTILYYLCILLMVEFDSKKSERIVSVSPMGQTQGIKYLMLRYGYHFISPIAIVLLMIVGFSANYAVFWSVVIAFAVSFIRHESALVPVKLIAALKKGTIDVLQVAATCAGAGIIVGVVGLTGLGLQFSGLIIDLAGGSLLMTILFTAFAIWVIGLAVPITASYIICVVICAPAMIKLGVPDYAAHMFVFYYAVLSEVTPPTALNAFAASAITGGNPYKIIMMSWKYTLPVFLVPIIFTVHPAGDALLLKGSLTNMIVTNVTALMGVSALAAGLCGWLICKTSWTERSLLVAAGFILVYPATVADIIGISLVSAVTLWQWCSLKIGRRKDVVLR